MAGNWARSLLCGVLVVGCRADAPPAAERPAITLRVKTNMNVIRDLDEVVISFVQQGATNADWSRRYPLGSEGDEFQLPATLDIVPRGTKTFHVSLVVTARRDGRDIVSWPTALVIPENYEDELDAKLKAKQAEPEGARVQATSGSAAKDEFASPPRALLDVTMDGLCMPPTGPTCAENQLCIRGECVDNSQDFADLSLLRVSDQVQPSGSDADSCLAVAECFAAAVPVSPSDDCSFALDGDGEPNVAMLLPGNDAGFCGDKGCLLPLEAGEGFDFTEPEASVIQLDPRWCEPGGEAELAFVAVRCGQPSHTPTRSLCPTDDPRPAVNAGGAGGEGGEGGSGAEGGTSVVPTETRSSQEPYLDPVTADVEVHALLTVGDSVNKRPDGADYRLVGRPAGLGTLDNGDGAFTLLVTHQLGATEGSQRAHGGKGSFVSKWTFQNLLAEDGRDLGQRVFMSATSYATPQSAIHLESLGPSSLVPAGLLLDAPVGYEEPLFLSVGTRTPDHGSAWAFTLDGDVYDLPELGSDTLGGIAVLPVTGPRTWLAAPTRAESGQLSFYAGTKLAKGAPVELAGLDDAEMGRWGLSIKSSTKAAVSTDPATASLEADGAGFFDYLGEGAWDPANPSDYYFLLSDPLMGNSQLAVVHIADWTQPDAVGTAEALLQGTEGQHVLSHLMLDGRGHIYLGEEPQDDSALCQLWRYDIESRTLTAIAKASARFDPDSKDFITSNENITGIVDASAVLGPGWLFVSFQANSPAPGFDTELVAGGQLLAVHDSGAP